MTVLVSTHYMDEAERCHRINYLSYGKLEACGTIKEILQQANLETWVLEGEQVGRAAQLLRHSPGVDQVAPFGLSLHVVGENHRALAESVQQVSKATGTSAYKGQTSLEDVFIQFMGKSTDPSVTGPSSNTA